MSRSDRSSYLLRRAISLALSGAAFALPMQAIAQDGQDSASQELEEVVVTGFRGSLNTALTLALQARMRTQAGMIAHAAGASPSRALKRLQARSLTDSPLGRRVLPAAA